MERKELIRTIYLYLFSLVGLVLIVIGLVKIVDLGLKTYIFPKADQVIIYPEYPIKASRIAGETQQELTSEELEKYKADQQEMQKKQTESNRARTASSSLALLIIGAPLFLYHWKIIQKDKNGK